jgi:hypothetical protein
MNIRLYTPTIAGQQRKFTLRYELKKKQSEGKKSRVLTPLPMPPTLGGLALLRRVECRLNRN